MPPCLRPATLLYLFFPTTSAMNPCNWQHMHAYQYPYILLVPSVRFGPPPLPSKGMACCVLAALVLCMIGTLLRHGSSIGLPNICNFCIICAFTFSLQNFGRSTKRLHFNHHKTNLRYYSPPFPLCTMGTRGAMRWIKRISATVKCLSSSGMEYWTSLLSSYHTGSA